MQTKTAFSYISSNSFELWVFKCFFSQYGYNFDDAIKIGYFRPNKVYDVIIYYKAQIIL